MSRRRWTAAAVESFKSLAPKSVSGGCFAASNVPERGRGWSRDYPAFGRARPDFIASADPRGSAGLAIRFKK
jgi:hypothetical protein